MSMKPAIQKEIIASTELKASSAHKSATLPRLFTRRLGEHRLKCPRACRTHQRSNKMNYQSTHNLENDY